MKIILDGKNNIIDNMYTDLPKEGNNSGMIFTDTERAKIIDRINKKVTYDFYHKPVLIIKEVEESNYSANPDMTKAIGDVRPGHKYIKRVPKSNGKGFYYFYTQPEYDKFRGEQQQGWLSKIASLFNFKDTGQAMKKIMTDYEQKNISSRFNLPWDAWKNHVAAYFTNKEKWDNFFSGKKQAKKESGEKKESDKEKKTTDKKASANGLKLAVMKELFNIYGKKKEEEKAVKQIVPVVQLTETQPQEIQPVVPEVIVETHMQQAEDKKIATALNEVTPEIRNETERKILGIPEPEDVEEIKTPIANFVPKDTEITIPFYKGGGSANIAVKDYTAVIPKDIYLAREKTILTESKPAYIPEIDEEFFKYSNNWVPIVKLGEDKYLIQTGRKRILNSLSVSNVIEKGTDAYAIVNRDVLAATQDYYLKRAKAKMKEYIKEKQSTTTFRVKNKRVSMLPETKMSYSQSDLIQSFLGNFPRYDREGSKKIWAHYAEIRQDLKQKTEDMEIQLEEYYNTHAKGRETAYGDKGLKDNLLGDYGIKVKRQNGAEITDVEISEIKLAMDDLFSVFGNRSAMAKNFGLKISHSGNVLQHARSAAGLFMPAIKAIGITTKYGQKGTGFILAHEWGHFMDHYIGNQTGRHHISDDPEHVAGRIVSLFRENMSKKQSSVYQNRTCECFARAMEQYWAIKTDNLNIAAEWDKGNHPTDEVFKEKIMPLIDGFFKNNENMLKAFSKNVVYKYKGHIIKVIK